MVIDLICENNSNKLCDPGKNQISMQSPLILGSASCKTEIVFDVVDISFDNSPDFIGKLAKISGLAAALSDHTQITINILQGINIILGNCETRGARS